VSQGCGEDGVSQGCGEDILEDFFIQVGNNGGCMGNPGQDVEFRVVVAGEVVVAGGGGGRVDGWTGGRVDG
jgi:hypothetical protein